MDRDQGALGQRLRKRRQQGPDVGGEGGSHVRGRAPKDVSRGPRGCREEPGAEMVAVSWTGGWGGWVDSDGRCERGLWQGCPPSSQPEHLEGWGPQDSESEMPEALGGRQRAGCSPVPGPALGHTLRAWLQGPGRPSRMFPAPLLSRPRQRGCTVAWTLASSTRRSRSGTSTTPP